LLKIKVLPLSRYARPDTLCMDSSTIDPVTARKVYEAALAKKVHFLDAPVAGGRKALVFKVFLTGQ